MRFSVWGMSGTLATQHHHDEPFVAERLRHWIAQIDQACNRFRPDSEISRLNRAGTRAMGVSAVFELALDAALRAYDETSGLCDPTVLPALVALGYDRDYDELAREGSAPACAPVLPLGPTAITWDRRAHTVALAPGCQLDLGASAKALLADVTCADAALRGGAVVEVGGDVAVTGEGPEGPWAIAVSDRLELNGLEPRISLRHGGVATSSSTTRTWLAGARRVHHIIDPRTGDCADSPIATASVSAADCVSANAFATAALLWGEDAGYHIAQSGWSARLVRHDGSIEYVGGWPAEEMAS